PGAASTDLSLRRRGGWRHGRTPALPAVQQAGMAVDGGECRAADLSAAAVRARVAGEAGERGARVDQPEGDEAAAGGTGEDLVRAGGGALSAVPLQPSQVSGAG